MKNQELRKQVLSDGTYQKYSLERKQRVFNNELEQFINSVTDPEQLECENIRRCQKSQRQKVEDHIKYMFMKPQWDLYFVTFSFNDYALSLSAETRKKAITRLLGSICADYIVNIDYGKTTNREHYHAVIRLVAGTYETYINNKHIKIKELDSYKYGFYDLEPIEKTDIDAKRLSRYETKLTLHSVKVKQQYISTKKGSMYQQYKDFIDKRKKLCSYSQYPRKWEKLQTINRAIENNITEESKTISKLCELFETNWRLI